MILLQMKYSYQVSWALTTYLKVATGLDVFSQKIQVAYVMVWSYELTPNIIFEMTYQKGHEVHFS